MQTRHRNYATVNSVSYSLIHSYHMKTQLEHINMGTEKLYIYEYS